MNEYISRYNEVTGKELSKMTSSALYIPPNQYAQLPLHPEVRKKEAAILS